MCLNSFSSCNLIGLSSSLAITLGETFSAEELALLAAFFTSFADNLAIISVKKGLIEESEKK